MLDESGSIGPSHFNLMKSFLSQLVSKLVINDDNARVGLVTFSTEVGTGFNLSDYSTCLLYTSDAADE